MTVAGVGLLPYVAGAHARWLVETPDLGWNEVDGSVLFADISGFTPLTERLARRGKVGAEELTDTLNDLFGRLLGVAVDFGADCLKFGGDAVVLLFRGDDHAGRAGMAARSMFEVMRSYPRVSTDSGQVRLGMSAGLHSGRFLLAMCGRSHRELVVAGPEMTETLRLEASASSGRVAISESARRAGAGRSARRKYQQYQPGVPPESGALSDAATAGLPAALRNYLTGDRHEGEHRIASVGFVQIGGIDTLLSGQAASHVAARLDDLIERAQTACETHGVTFLSTDVDKNAIKVILAAGVPASSADDEDRLLHALREIVGHSDELPIRAGANRGRVFAVDLGSHQRRTFTIIGDAVNLAARIMGQASPGQVLASQDILDRVRTQFHLTPLPPFQVKGKTGLVQAAAVGEVTGVKPEVHLSDVPLVGRDRERDLLRQAVVAAHEGSCTVIELVGEPGIGKSKLVACARDLAASTRQLTVSGGRYSRATPYFALRPAVTAVLGLTLGSSDPGAADELSLAMDRTSAGSSVWLPLIAPILGIDAPTKDNETTSRLDVANRSARLRSVLVDLVAKSVNQPALWVIEDAHWLDSATTEFLGSLLAGASRQPWVFLVTRRPTRHGFSVAGESAIRVDLQPLSEAECASLGSKALASASATLPPGVLERLVARSSGNPLFLQELVQAAATHDMAELPESVEAVVSATIDTLAAPARDLLRRASVLGSHFPRSVLARTLELDPSELDAELAGLSRFLSRKTDGSVGFRHILLRDVAYEGLPFRTRRRLHLRAGEVWEAEAGEHSEDFSELLAVHFHAAGDYQRSWRYSRVAGSRSERNGAPIEAATFYSQAVEAGRHLPDVAVELQVAMAESFGNMLARSGRYDESRAAFGRARRLSKDPVSAARLHRKTGGSWESEGRLSEAMRACRRGMRALGSADVRPEVLKEKAKLTAGYAAVLLTQGRHLDAVPLLEEAARLAEEGAPADTRAALGRIYRLLDWTRIELSRQVDEPYAEKALAIYRELGDEMGVSATFNNMGLAAHYEGRWDDAVSCFEEAHDAGGRAGSVAQQALLLNNIAEIRSDQGHFVEAQNLLLAALDTWRSTRNRFEGMTLGNLGRVAARDARFDEADSWYRMAVEFLERTGEDALLAETLARESELWVLKGRPSEALDGIARATRTADHRAMPHTLELAERVTGYALAQQGHLERGWQHLSKSVLLAREIRDEYGSGLGLEGLARIGVLRQIDNVAGRMSADAQAIFSRLGVVKTPEVPLSSLCVSA